MYSSMFPCRHTPKVVKAASQVLNSMWQYRDLRSLYKKVMHSEDLTVLISITFTPINLNRHQRRERLFAAEWCSYTSRC